MLQDLSYTQSPAVKLEQVTLAKMSLTATNGMI
jgi:hypothetical protein